MILPIINMMKFLEFNKITPPIKNKIAALNIVLTLPKESDNLPAIIAPKIETKFNEPKIASV